MLHDLIANYGVLAVLLGAGTEGETAAFLGGVFAHRHILAYWQVALAAGLGSFLADQVLFLAGRYAARSSFVGRMIASPAMRRVTSFLETHPTSFIFAFRFIYGIRTVSPVAIGLSKIPAVRFLILNSAAAFLWGVVITAIGYLFGDAVETLFGRLHLHIHLLITLAVAVTAVAIVAVVMRWRRQVWWRNHQT